MHLILSPVIIFRNRMQSIPEGRNKAVNYVECVPSLAVAEHLLTMATILCSADSHHSNLPLAVTVLLVYLLLKVDCGKERHLPNFDTSS